MVNRKASIIKEMMNKVDALQACESTSKDEIENYKEVSHSIPDQPTKQNQKLKII